MSKKAIWIVALLLGLGVGGFGGFFLGTLTSEFGRKMLESAFLSEQDAVTEKPLTISRKHFSAGFPGNWFEDKKLPYYEAEHFLSFNSPGGSWVMLQIYDVPTDPAVNVEQHAKEESVSLKQITKTPFSKWGQYTGKGMELKGKSMGYYPARVRIFSYSSEKKSFVVLEQHYNEDEKQTGPGFALVEKMFRLKGA